jgi:hypothetical protein
VTSRRAQRRALERADDVLEAGSASRAYAVRRVQSTAAATEGGSPVDHPSHRQARNLDRQGQGGADPRPRPRRPRPADSPGVRRRPRERNGPIAAPRPGAVDPKADERTPKGSQHRAPDSAVTSRLPCRLRRRLWRRWVRLPLLDPGTVPDEPQSAAAGPGARVRGHDAGGGYGAAAVAGARRCAASRRRCATSWCTPTTTRAWCTGSSSRTAVPGRTGGPRSATRSSTARPSGSSSTATRTTSAPGGAAGRLHTPGGGRPCHPGGRRRAVG